MYINGIGKTKFGILQYDLAELMYKAVDKALEDAALEAKDVGAAYIGNFGAGMFCNQIHLNSLLSSLLAPFDKPAIRVEAACASGGAALAQAVIAGSRYDNILVVGVEKMTTSHSKDATSVLAAAGDRKLDQEEGLSFAAAYAIIAQAYMQKNGVGHEVLEAVSYKNHSNANMNPLAQFYGDKVTMEKIRGSPMVASPLNLYDCSPVSDGAAAVVVSREKASDDSVEIAASEIATGTLSLSQRSDLTSFDAAKIAAARAFKAARLKCGDISLFEVHDCFTIAELVAMGDIGICPPGKVAELVRDGETAIGGRFPVNPSGGLIGSGHPVGATGVSQACEAVLQLRGKAGKRQVDGAEAALTHNVGGAGGTAVVHILRRK